MNFKSKIKQAGILASAIMGLLAVTPATANLVGSTTLSLTDGCFSYGAAGEGAGGCNNININNLAYATGKFEFNDTLLSVYGGPASLALQPFSYEGIVTMQANAPGHLLASFVGESQSWADWASMSSDPMMILGLSLFQTVISNPNGPPHSISFDFTALPGGQAFTLHWVLSGVVSNAAHITGDFTAWSEQDLNWLSQLFFQQSLPAEANFAAQISLNASTSMIPEPVSLALVGLGIFGMGVTHRRRKYSWA